ncbi:MAG TPA: hypothetical protein VFC61_10325 [Blastocatellia bacterium]|nr:hypothetical protein [Blastocatellia bacterium]
MTDAVEALAEKVKALAGGWPSYAALGGFILYLLGYLSLRFHLTSLGIGTDLTVLDERYVFTGAKFLVYLGATIPIIALLALPPAGLAYLTARLWSWAARGRSGAAAGGRWRRAGNGRATPTLLALAGIVLSVVLIQFVMRQCFVFANLLLAPRLPEPIWLRSLLLAEGDGPRALYFSGLVAGCAAAAGLCWAARARAPQTPRARALTAALAVLAGIQFLLLPVNYGVLIIDKVLPRVADLGGVEALREGQEAWLVWEGKDGVTYLVRGPEGRRLVTLPQREVKRTQIIGYDAILRRIFLEDGENTTEIDHGNDPLFCGFDPGPQPLPIRPRAGAEEASEEADFLGAAAQSHGHLGHAEHSERAGGGFLRRDLDRRPRTPLRAAGDARGRLSLARLPARR